MSKQLIIKQHRKDVLIRKNHVCDKCQHLLLVGDKVQTIEGHINDRFGKAFMTLYFCLKHRLKKYCEKKVIYT